MGSEKPDLKMVHWENHPHEQKSQKEYVYKRFMKIWKDYAHKILTPRSTQKPHSLWKSINLHNLLSGALRKPPSRAEFSKGTWFLRRLSLNLLKNHILFGNGLWKARFENGDLRKPPSQAEFSKGSQAEFSKRTWFLRRLSLNLIKNHILFGNRLWKVQIWKWCIEKTTPTSRNLKKNMYIKGSWRYEEIMPIRSYRSLSLDLLKNHIHCGSL